MSSAEVKYTVLATAPNQASKVLLCETSYGTCVLKRWLKDRVAIGGNRSQPLAEYSALLDLHALPNINAPLKVTLDKEGVDFIYVHCGQNALHWRSQLVHEDDPNNEQIAEQLAQHVAVHVLQALQELESRGLVHRDVKPTNILLRNYPTGGTWLSDMGLMTRAQELSGFVKGLDPQYIPPEYTTYDIPQQQQQQQQQPPAQQQQHWHIKDNLVDLAAVTTTAADMYQLGLMIFELVEGSLPHSLQPPKHSNPKRYSSFLQRVATFNWPREVSRQISNPEIAEVLVALLSSNPELRPRPAGALTGFQWLQEGVALAGQQPPSSNLERESAWAAEQLQALRAAQYIEFLRLQEEFAGQPYPTPVSHSAPAGYTSHSQQSTSVSSKAQQDSRHSGYTSFGSTPFATPQSTPHPSPAATLPVVSAEDSFAGLPTSATAAAAGDSHWVDLAPASPAEAAAAAAADADEQPQKQISNWGPPAVAAVPSDQAASPTGHNSWHSTPFTSPVAVKPTVCAEDAFGAPSVPVLPVSRNVQQQQQLMMLMLLLAVGGVAAAAGLQLRVERSGRRVSGRYEPPSSKKGD